MQLQTLIQTSIICVRYHKLSLISSKKMVMRWQLKKRVLCRILAINYKINGNSSEVTKGEFPLLYPAYEKNLFNTRNNNRTMSIFMSTSFTISCFGKRYQHPVTFINSRLFHPLQRMEYNWNQTMPWSYILLSWPNNSTSRYWPKIRKRNNRLYTNQPIFTTGKRKLSTG